ncbi:LysM peptidoglycan-binding domain-containing protein [Lutibacter sp. B2]|nr:LysM peptidoglycan-binding domain-containing protein [Lutibacter sp. B2]
MNFKKMIISGLLGVSVLVGSVGISYGNNAAYTVASGDTFWIISQKQNVSIEKLMEANNANENTILYVGKEIVIPTNENTSNIHTVGPRDTYWIISQKYNVDIYALMSANNATEKTVLNVGDQISIPSDEKKTEVYIVDSGDTFWIISQKKNVSIGELMKVNNADEKTMLYVGQEIMIPQNSSSTNNTNSTDPYITYNTYKVQSGDDFWKISIKFGISYQELLKANNMNETTMLNIGDTLKIPVHHVPIKYTPSHRYGEYLDWWTEAQYVVPVGAEFKVEDFYTGKTFMAKRTTGSNHADVEALTKNDTNIMKEVWGGNLTWDRRPVIIYYNGRKLAASVSGMPHAGNDYGPGGEYTSWRSGDYGAGYNFDWVKNNGMDGHFDIHFANSTRHNDGEIDEKHQANVKIAAGVK